MIPITRKPITDAEFTQYLKRAPEIGIVQACKELGRLPQSFRYRMIREGHQIQRLGCSFALNPEQFETITSPEVAYILGLLWADGHVRPRYYTISIELDKADLLAIKPVFDRTGQWHYSERVRKGRSKPIACLQVANQRVRAVLDACSYRDKSRASPTRILERISASLHPLFWRGYIDGDGCFYRGNPNPQFSLAGSFDQDWSASLAMCSALKVRPSIQRVALSTGRSSSLRVTARMDIERLGDWIYATYNTDNIGLPRKREAFLAIKAKCHASRNGRYARKYSDAIIPSVRS